MVGDNCVGLTGRMFAGVMKSVGIGKAVPTVAKDWLLVALTIFLFITSDETVCRNRPTPTILSLSNKGWDDSAQPLHWTLAIHCVSR